MTAEADWPDFIEFLGRAPATDHPGVLFEGFRQDLVARGVPEDEAAARMRGIVELAHRRSDWAAPMFDRIYTSGDSLFRPEPNAFVVEMAAARPTGHALDVAMGQGRNAVHLAGAGWTVTGFDLSPAGVATAADAATAQGTPIAALVCASEDFQYGTAAWDLIVMTYALVPVAEDAFAAMIGDALRPGGLVVIESFAFDDSRPRRPVDVEPDRLRAAYGGLREVHFEVDHAEADWTLEAQPVVRFAAERA
jgi:SAM-dependent methyltransferase